MTIRCPSCRETKTDEAFSKASRRANKRQSWCKLCQAGHDRLTRVEKAKDGYKVCSSCKVLKHSSEFNPSNNRQKLGLSSKCIECNRRICGEWYKNNKIHASEKAREYYEKNKERIIARNKQYRQKNLTRIKESDRLRKYGLKEGEFNKLLRRQGGACACCRVIFSPPVVPYVDHNHVTGKARGILCGHCNKGIGQARESIPVLRSWIEYLIFHSGK